MSAPRRAVSIIVFLLGVLPAVACAQDAGPADAAAALRTGQYEQAIRMARAEVAAAPADLAARRTLVRALAETGAYAEAESAARDGDALEMANLLGETLHAQGKIAEAEAAFRRAAEGGAADRLPVELNLALLLLGRGERDEAMERFDGFIDDYNGARALSAAELTAVGTAVEHLGARDPQLFRDALRAYDEAIAADPGDPEPRLRLAELFIAKYNSPDARATLREVLAVNPSNPRALLGMALVQEFDGAIGEAFATARQALEINPNLVPARVTLARLYLTQEDTRAAEEEIRRALAVNPAALEALATLAAVRFVQGDEAGYAELRDRALGLNPRYAGFYTTVAEIAANFRRYAQAATLAREAVSLDPQSWASHGVLGLNELRLGRVDAARESLERSFEGDPYNAWIKNTLDLLDTYPEYRLLTTPRFEILLHGDEAELLYPYVSRLAEEAYDSLAARYGYQPETPVRLEFYPRHADFSVRTVGLAGLGALGVSFGNVLAMDSPRARDPGQLNWGSTLWHELTHAVTLGLSNHRVPRWLTEGLSVLEERRARPGWGSEMMPAFLAAYYEGELPPVSRLNEGFVRPASPRHLALSYHLASMTVEWIEETRGFDAILRMLRAYGEGQSTPEVLRTGLGVDPEAVDREFDAWLRERYPPDMVDRLREAMAVAEPFLTAGDALGAARRLEAAVEVLPEYANATDSPLALLAAALRRAEDQRGTADALRRLTLLDENAYEENLELAGLLEGLGDPAGAAEALERAMYIYPYDLEVHTRLAELYTGLGDLDRVVRERTAIVALRPVDEAGARYQLAVAHAAAGDRAAARREIIRALEIAPAFERAQELLLELRGDG